MKQEITPNAYKAGGYVGVENQNQFTPIVDVLTKPEWSHYRGVLQNFFTDMENNEHEFFTITPFENGVVLDVVGYDKNMRRQKDTLYVDGVVLDERGLEFFRVRLITRVSEGIFNSYETLHRLNDSVLLPVDSFHEYFYLLQAVIHARVLDNVRAEFYDEVVIDYHTYVSEPMKTASRAVFEIERTFSEKLPEDKFVTKLEIDDSGKPYFVQSILLNKEEEIVVEMTTNNDTHIQLKIFLLKEGKEYSLVQTNKDCGNLKDIEDSILVIVERYVRTMTSEDD